MVIFLTLFFFLDSPKEIEKTKNSCTAIVIALKADQRIYPTRNTCLSRRSVKSGLPTSTKVKVGIKLLKNALPASYFILLAGDVNPNPGPIKDPCGLCTKGCRKNQKAVQCDDYLVSRKVHRNGEASNTLRYAFLMLTGRV